MAEGEAASLEGGVGGVGGPANAMAGAAAGPAGQSTGASAKNAKSAAANATAATPYRYCMPTHAVYTFPAPTARISLYVVCRYIPEMDNSTV